MSTNQNPKKKKIYLKKEKKKKTRENVYANFNVSICCIHECIYSNNSFLSIAKTK